MRVWSRNRDRATKKQTTGWLRCTLQQKFARVMVVSAVSSAPTWYGSELVARMLQRRWGWRGKIAVNQELGDARELRRYTDFKGLQFSAGTYSLSYRS